MHDTFLDRIQNGILSDIFHFNVISFIAFILVSTVRLNKLVHLMGPLAMSSASLDLVSYGLSPMEKHFMRKKDLVWYWAIPFMYWFNYLVSLYLIQ